jgi:hypothetical protein
MAAPSGNGSLLAGLGAFAVVVGGLAAYKHFKASPKSSPEHDQSGIPAPDVEAMPAAPDDVTDHEPVVTVDKFVDSHVQRAFGLLGKPEESVRAVFLDDVRAYDDANDNSANPLYGATLASTVTLSDLYNYSANIGFFLNEQGIVTRVVIATSGENEATAKAFMAALEHAWGIGKLTRKDGIGLAFQRNETNVFAQHHMLDNTWVLTAEQSGNLGATGSLFGSENSYADCALVGKKPSHLGVGKLFVLGQPANVVATTAKRIEPDMTPEFDDDSLALASGLANVDISVTLMRQKLRTITYLLNEQRAAEINACWRHPSLHRDDQTYWLVGNERYRLTGLVLDIERVERLSDVVAEVRAAVGKRYSLVEHLEIRSSVAGVPDTSLTIAFDSVGTTQEQTEPNADYADVVVDFTYASELDQILKEFERTSGATQLARNAGGIPVLRATKQGVQFEIQPYSNQAVALHIAPSAATTR